MKSGLKTLAMWLIIGVIFIVLLTSIMNDPNTKMTYSELINKIESTEVKEIELLSDEKKANVTLKDSNLKKSVNIPNLESFMRYIEEPLRTGTVTLSQKDQSIFVTILSLLTPFGLLIIFLIFWFFVMNGQQGGNKTMSFGKSKARLMGTEDKNKVTFEDVAGVDEEKEELEEIVQFLKNPRKFTDTGECSLSV